MSSALVTVLERIKPHNRPYLWMPIGKDAVLCCFDWPTSP
jgi:hypothetical protein